jgi:hypothetical protein
MPLTPLAVATSGAGNHRRNLVTDLPSVGIPYPHQRLDREASQVTALGSTRLGVDPPAGIRPTDVSRWLNCRI